MFSLPPDQDPKDLERFDDEAWADEVLRPKILELRRLAHERNIPLLISIVSAVIEPPDDPSRTAAAMTIIATMPQERTPSNMRLAAFILQNPPFGAMVLPVKPDGTPDSDDANFPKTPFGYH